MAKQSIALTAGKTIGFLALQNIITTAAKHFIDSKNAQEDFIDIVKSSFVKDFLSNTFESFVGGLTGFAIKEFYEFEKMNNKVQEHLGLLAPAALVALGMQLKQDGSSALTTQEGLIETGFKILNSCISTEIINACSIQKDVTELTLV